MMNAAEEKNTPLIEVNGLVVHYETEDGVVEAVNNVSFKLNHGETLGLIGETGAGKTTIALALMRLLPVPPSHIVQGSIKLDGDDLLGKTEKEMRKIRGHKISMIFQDPMTALNPVHCVGDQIAEVISLHQHVTNKEATIKAMEMLRTVGIPEERYRDYPHQFSGGMKQRVVIAIALACRPELIIADEPTTALDVTIQAQVLELMKGLRKEFNTSMLLITHDFGVVAEVCDRCAVIYAGEIVESGTVEHIFNHPLHPYTLGLFDSLPSMNEDVEHLTSIPGLMVDPMDLPNYCSFYDRCRYRSSKCSGCDPELREVEPGHFVKCLYTMEQEGGN
jgi:peptide/nickel transport system ATP-binding protein